MVAIRAQGLVREYRLGKANVVRALQGADLSVEAGEFVAVLGKSGSGKSTLLNLLGGLDRPTGGELEVDGRDLVRLSERDLARFRAGTVGFVFQSFHLQPRFAAWENVALPLVFAGVRRPERRRRALALLERVGLTERADHRPSQLSGGEQQRVALARSLVAAPRLLLGDEPTGNLDSATSAAILDLLAEAHRGGATVVLVTHDAELAAERAQRCVRMADGRVVSDSGAAVAGAGP
jgi:putative ABC transport system ATP-binding protein